MSAIRKNEQNNHLGYNNIARCYKFLFMMFTKIVNKRLIFLQLTFLAFVLNFLQKEKLENFHTPSKKTFLKKNDKKNFSQNQWFNVKTHLKP